MHSRRTKLIALIVILIIVVVGSYFFVQHEFTERAKAEVNAQIEALNPAVTITYRHLTTEPLSRKVTIKDIVIEPPKVTGQPPMKIRSASFNFKQNRQGQLVDLNAWIKEAKSPLIFDEKSYPALYSLSNQLDGKQVVSNVTLHYQYDVDTKIATMQLKQDAQSLAQVKFAIQIGNFVPGPLSIEQARGVTLNGFSFQYTDNSLIPKLIKIKSSLLNLDEATYTQQLVSKLQGKAALAKNSFQQQFFMQVAKLIQNPGTLRISATPAQPVPILRLRFTGDQEVINELDLEVTTLPPPPGNDTHAA